tara:strand:- start:5037 stop:7277 length:2241 start_codon:yes stop_codon:yes gene_type:complete
MPLNLASPGIVVREVDLTNGRVDATSTKTAGLAAPFAKGPVERPQLIETEADLLDTFGQPYPKDNHYEYWLTASSYLAYGGVMRVVRADDEELKNGFVGVAASVKIKSVDDYVDAGYAENTLSGVTYAAKNPGSWSNGIKVATIDAFGDQVLSGIVTTDVLGYGSTTVPIDPINLKVGYAVTQTVPAGTVIAGAGSTSILDGFLKGIITEIGNSTITVKVVSHVSGMGTETAVDYQQAGTYQFSETGNLGIHTNESRRYGSWRGLPANEYSGLTTYTGSVDWFDQQLISLSNGSTVKWNQIAERPGTSSYAAQRNSRFDEVHVVAYDDTGTLTGNSGTILEKHTSLSKAKDALYSAGAPAYWRKVIEVGSPNLFAGGAPAGITSTGFADDGWDTFGDGGWDQNTENIAFSCIGNYVKILGGGKDYNGISTITESGALNLDIGALSEAYDYLRDPDLFDIDFLLLGNAAHGKHETQALSNKLIEIAEFRKDCVAFLSPFRGSFLTPTGSGESLQLNVDTVTDNIVSYYSPITSSSYAVLDSGYKYMYDRFNQQFRYIPMNGDIAGTCARNDINNFPWFSPGGTARGAILNAVKLAYAPNKVHRDKLYSNRINPIIFSPGAGIILFGDKTGLGRSSAFDRINVRRLFIFLEKAIAAAAKDVLFEFNDEITRINFINIVEPFLRDVQSKRGIQDFVVICDETNNTPAIIDSNEFVADIYIKPARSINFIGLTFVATRTGVSFDEVIGKV